MRLHSGKIMQPALLAIALIFSITGCAQNTRSAKDGNLAGNNVNAVLQSIKVADDASRIEISADRQLVYTYYKLNDSPKVVIDLAQTTQGSITSPVYVYSGNIKMIEIGRHDFGESILSRIEITLITDELFSVTADPADKRKLLVNFARAKDKEVKPEAATMSKAPVVEDIAPPAAAKESAAVTVKKTE